MTGGPFVLAAAMGAANFADQVLRELVAALGAALFVGNLMALLRRRRERPASDTSETGTDETSADESEFEHAPIARTLLYLVVGFVVMLWGVASILVA